MFAEAPGSPIWRKGECKLYGNYTMIYRSLLSQLLFSLGTKKGKGDVVFFCFYGRFRSVRIMTAPIITITTMIAAMPGSRYVSAIDGAVVACGACVGAAESTAKLVSEYDGQ